MGLVDGVAAGLALDFRLGLPGGEHAPQLGEGVHIKGEVVQLVVVDGHRGVDVVVELTIAVDVLPDLLVGGVENVGAIGVDQNALHLLAVGVASQMGPAVDDETALAGGGHLLGKSGAI